MKRNAGEIKKLVRAGYAKVARKGTSCCPSGSCCGGAGLARNISTSIGYSEEEMTSVPGDANLGLGCGNPVAIAELKKGDVVLDLGSGAGFDVFLAARRVGRTGCVIGVDMTPGMIRKARANAKRGRCANVEFRLGEIEALPVESSSVDVIISNCVINLSPDKQKVFDEAFRVLRPGGRLMISDLVLEKELPKAVRDSIEAYVACLAGASMKRDYLTYMRKAGFGDIQIVSRVDYPVEEMLNDVASRKGAKAGTRNMKILKGSVARMSVRAVRPRKAGGAQR
jgi:arsenite methyltransferase